MLMKNESNMRECSRTRHFRSVSQVSHTDSKDACSSAWKTMTHSSLRLIPSSNVSALPSNRRKCCANNRHEYFV